MRVSSMRNRTSGGQPAASRGWGTALRVFDKVVLIWCGLEGGRFRARVRVGHAVRSLGR